ncbi:MAG: hypothetical protein F6J93_39130 [Oscillatoria sp. SIO1A7]|nr:hypothetical protein [Oscillatoria sp. SIO1A7]
MKCSLFKGARNRVSGSKISACYQNCRRLTRFLPNANMPNAQFPMP